MEIIIALIVVVFGLGIYYNRKKKEEVVVDVPYKVETPVEVAPVAVADVPVTLAVDGHGDVQEVAPAKKTRKPRAVKAEKPAAKKAPAKAKSTAKKPAAIKAKAKKS